MPLKKRVLIVGGLGLLLGGSLNWWSTQAHWNAALYCITEPNRVWSVAPRPQTWQLECPQSASYRREIRNGDSRVEQFRLRGWQPKAVLKVLQDAGYRQLEDELLGQDHYSAFIGKSAPGEIFYTAKKEGVETLVTVSGP